MQHQASPAVACPSCQTLELMRAVGHLVLGIIFLGLCFGLGWFLVSRGINTLELGQLTYSRKGHAPVTVSPQAGAFSFYYQVAFFVTSGGFLLLLGFSCVLFGIAKFIRSTEVLSTAQQFASVIYRVAVWLAWSGIGLCCLWLLLRIFRYWLIQ